MGLEMKNRDKYKKGLLSTASGGFTLVEMLVALGIFSVIMSGLFAAYSTQVKHTSREYRIAEGQVEVGIAKGIIERDLILAGYGLADDYSDALSPAVTTPIAVRKTDSNPDTLVLMGTALGINSRGAQGWNYIRTTTPALSFGAGWGDLREDLTTGDRVIIMEADTKKLHAEAGEWLFVYDGATPSLTTTPGNVPLTPPDTPGQLVYGLSASTVMPGQPYYAVKYQLDRIVFPLPLNCESSTFNLVRAESLTTSSPIISMGPPQVGTPLLSCVLDMEVGLGLDTATTDGIGPINQWDHTMAPGVDTYDSKTLGMRLRQMRVYLLIQVGNKDPDYTASSTIWVGDQTLGIGRSVTLSAAQQKYRWRVLTINLAPRNIR